MSRAREQRRQARLALHNDRAVPAFYIPVAGETPVACTVRVHTKNVNEVGALPGFQGNATVAEFEPRIIFLASEVPAPRPKQGVVSVEPGEAYQIEAVDPVDGITITAKVSRLSAERAANLPVPE